MPWNQTPSLSKTCSKFSVKAYVWEKHDILSSINIRKQSKGISTCGILMGAPADLEQIQEGVGCAGVSPLKLHGLGMAAVYCDGRVCRQTFFFDVAC